MPASTMSRCLGDGLRESRSRTRLLGASRERKMVDPETGRLLAVRDQICKVSMNF
jgi:hypothetical protein